MEHFLLAVAAVAAALSTADAATSSGSFSQSQPVNWISVAPGQPARIWVENAAGGWLSEDGGRSFRAPASTSAFRRAQVAQATLLADGKTLIGMPTVWSSQQFSPPRWSADGGVTWQAGALHGADAHFDFGDDPAFVGESPVTADPGDAHTAWFCQGNLYVTHDAGRTWAVASPRFKRPWHCAALAIAPGKAHTLLLLSQSTGRNARRVPGKLLRSVDGGATWHAARAPRYPQLDYNGHTIAFDPAKPSTALMIGAHDGTLGTLYRTIDAGRSWKRVRPAGTLRGAVVDQFAFASRRARTRSGAHRRPPESDLRLAGRRPALGLGTVADARHDVASGLCLAARSERQDRSCSARTGEGFWRLEPDARRWARP